MRNEAQQLAALLHDPTEVNLQEGECVRALRRLAAASLELGCALLQLAVVLLRYLLLFRRALQRVDERSRWSAFGSEGCALAIQELLGCRLACLIGWGRMLMLLGARHGCCAHLPEHISSAWSRALGTARREDNYDEGGLATLRGQHPRKMRMTLGVASCRDGEGNLYLAWCVGYYEKVGPKSFRLLCVREHPTAEMALISYFASPQRFLNALALPAATLSPKHI